MRNQELNSCVQTVGLTDIQDNLRAIVSAIKSVINVDVTIVDASLNRIVATGEYVKAEGCKVDQHSVFSYALDFGRAFVIENPREHFACQQCAEKATCQEEAEVCCPITLNDKVIGVIGLIAMDPVQKLQIVENKENLLNFLMRMADLIASKLTEARQQQELELRSKELRVLLDAIDRAVIAVNTSGLVVTLNTTAKTLLKVKASDRLKDILPALDVERLLAGKDDGSELAVKTAAGVERLIYTVQRIRCAGKVQEYVLTFTPVKELIEAVGGLMDAGRPTAFDDIVGEADNIAEVKRFAHKAARSSSTVLILGESGTGKELFARAIHHASERAAGPFVPVNCAAIPEGLLESELFGYEEGAFTGARTGGKIGKFELAHNGTLFLDEIGDMPLHLQAKLLRVLQDRIVERVGGKNGVPVNARVIVATNKVLEQLVQEGAFREDLYYRLSVLPIYVPPLRSRVADIPMLVHQFVQQVGERLEKTVVRVSDEVVERFMRYDWPGNVRELQNAIEYAVNMNTTGVIEIDDLPVRLRSDGEEASAHTINLKDLEQNALREALKRYGRSEEGVKRSCEALGISRATYYRKVKRLDT